MSILKKMPIKLREKQSVPKSTVDSLSNVKMTSDLIDLLRDGFFIIILLRQAYLPKHAEQFKQNILILLQRFEQQARELQFNEEEIQHAKYAYCSLLDETIVTQQNPQFLQLQNIWLSNPLQLNLFGSQLAGDHFFEIIEHLRSLAKNGLVRLEIFHYCLLLGFQGKYRIHSLLLLDHLSTCVEDEIRSYKNHYTFAPFSSIPDHIQHPHTHKFPFFALFIGLLILTVISFLGMYYTLFKYQQQALAPYQNMIIAPLEQAHITIHLP